MALIGASRFTQAIFTCLAATLILLPLAHTTALADVFSLPKAIILWLAGGITLFLFSLAVWSQGQFIFAKSRLLLLPFIFIVLLAVNPLVSIYPPVSLIGYRGLYQGLITYLAGFGLLVGGWQIGEGKDRELALYRIVAAVAVFLSFWAWLQFLGLDYPISFGEFDNRVGSFAGNPLDFAGLLTLSFPVIIAYFFAAPREKIWAGSALIMAATGLFLAQSLWALSVSFIVACIMGVFLMRRKPKVGKRRKLLTILPFALLGLGLFLARLPTRGASFSYRYMLWRAGISAAADRPLTGMGLDTFNYYIFRFAQPTNGLGEKKIDMPNIFINLAASAGVIASFVLAAFIAALILYLLSKKASDDDFSLGLAGSLLAFVLLTQVNHLSIGLLGYFWIMAGLSLAKITGKNDAVFVIKNRLLLSALVLISSLFLLVAGTISARSFYSEYYYAQARSYGVSPKSLELIDMATKMSPYNEYYYTMLASRAMGLSADGDKQFLTLAKFAAEKSRKINPSESNNYAIIGFYYLIGDEENIDLLKAERYLHEALERDPYNLNALFGLSKTYFLLKQQDQGKKWQLIFTKSTAANDDRVAELKALASKASK